MIKFIRNLLRTISNANKIATIKSKEMLIDAYYQNTGEKLTIEEIEKRMKV